MEEDESHILTRDAEDLQQTDENQNENEASSDEEFVDVAEDNNDNDW